MLVGDPSFPDQALHAGQRYVVWCSTAESSTGERTTSVFLATVVEAT
jgi:hypothetical protein